MTDSSPFLYTPLDRADRWSLLNQGVEQWYPPIQKDDGISVDDLVEAESKLNITIPISLREWCSTSGYRKDIWSRQDYLLHPKEYKFSDNHLIFMIENQDVVEWGIRTEDIELDDPPVYVSSVDEKNVWFKENDSISEFALQMFLYCLKWSDKCRWWANAYVDSSIIDVLKENYPRFQFPEWHWPTQNQFYGYRDIVAEVEKETFDDNAWLYIVTRTARAAEEFKNVVGSLNIEWNSWSDEWPPGWVSAAQDLK